MKKLIYGISFLAITGGVILVSCNKQNMDQNQSKQISSNVEKSTILTSDEVALFYKSVALVPQKHLKLNQETEFAQRFSLLNFNESCVLLDSYILDGIDYSDDGQLNDQVAGDGIYTSVITKPIDQYYEAPINEAFTAETFEHIDEIPSGFIKFGCKIKTTYSGYSAMGFPCSWGGCIVIYACKGSITFEW